MTNAEKLLLDHISLVLKGFGDIQREGIERGFEKYDGDNLELCSHIHALQNWVLANEASHTFPSEYRPFGCKFPPKGTPLVR